MNASSLFAKSSEPDLDTAYGVPTRYREVVLTVSNHGSALLGEASSSLLNSGACSQRFGFVGLFPGKAFLVASEMAVSSGCLVNRPAQVE